MIATQKFWCSILHALQNDVLSRYGAQHERAISIFSPEVHFKSVLWKNVVILQNINAITFLHNLLLI